MPNFCPNCGSTLEPSDKFCPNCGSTTQFPTAIPPTQRIEPLPSFEDEAEERIDEAISSFETPESSEPLPSNKGGLFFIPVILLIAILGWFAWQKWGQSSQNPFLGIPTDSTQINATNSPQTQVALSDFIGVWRPYASNDSEEFSVELGDPNIDMVLEHDGNRLLIYNRGNAHRKYHYQINCKELAGNTLDCNASDINAPDEVYHFTFELLPNKQELIITELPEASEMVILKTKRLPENPADIIPELPDEPIPLSQSYFPPVQGPISAEQAVQRIQLIPEVKEWLTLLDQAHQQPHFELVGEENGQYIIRIYEIVDDGGGDSHTATFGWYQVEIQTGKVDFYLP